MRRLNYLVYAVWFGLVTGTIEVLVVTWKASRSANPVPMSPDVVWMLPLFQTVLLVLLALLWCLFSVLRIHAVMLQTLAIASFAFVGAMGPLLATGRLHRYAVLLLGLGIAIQFGRAFRRRPIAVYVFMRRTALGLALAIIGIAGAIEGARAFTERRQVAQLPALAPNAPNVLLVVLDTVRAESVSLYGYQRPTTPALETLASNGVIFESALATAPWTLSSHASMFTGRYPHDLSADWTVPLDTRFPVLAEVLASQGYATAGFVANLIYGSRAHGLDRGFVHYEDFPRSIGQLILSSSVGTLFANSYRVRHFFPYHRVLNRKTAAEVNEDFLRWQARHRERPFFAFLNYFDAHEPYLPPPPFDRYFGHQRSANAAFWHTGVDAFRINKWALPETEKEAEVNAYDGTIAYMDAQLGKLIRELKGRGVLENTLVIVTSDHGEHLGERNLFSHGNSLYASLLHVPLVISFPGRVPAGVRIQQPISLRDLSATVLDLLRVDNQSALPGRSLAATWADRAQPVSPVLAVATKRLWSLTELDPLTKGDMKALIDDHHYYIVNGDGSEELYEFGRAVSDVLHGQNLVSEGTQPILNALRLALERTLAESSPPMAVSRR